MCVYYIVFVHLSFVMIKQLVVVLGGRVCVSFGFKVRYLPLQGDISDIHIYFAGFCSVPDKIIRFIINRWTWKGFNYVVFLTYESSNI